MTRMIYIYLGIHHSGMKHKNVLYADVPKNFLGVNYTKVLEFPIRRLYKLRQRRYRYLCRKYGVGMTVERMQKLDGRWYKEPEKCSEYILIVDYQSPLNFSTINPSSVVGRLESKLDAKPKIKGHFIKTIRKDESSILL